jgi:hypothetical protein
MLKQVFLTPYLDTFSNTNQHFAMFIQLNLFIDSFFSSILMPSVLKEFRVKSDSVTKTDFKTIEHLLRYGYKQKKLIEMPGFRSGSGAKIIHDIL